MASSSGGATMTADDDASFASAHEDNEDEYDEYNNGEEEPPEGDHGNTNHNDEEDDDDGDDEDDYTDNNSTIQTNSIDSSSQQQHSEPNNDNNNGALPPPPCFFADATLDLEEAHGLAETPIPSNKEKVSGGIVGAFTDVNLTPQIGVGDVSSHPLMHLEEPSSGTSDEMMSSKNLPHLPLTDNDRSSNDNNNSKNDGKNNTTTENNNSQQQQITTKTMNRITNTILGSGTALSTSGPTSTVAGTSSLMLDAPLPTTTSSMETSGAAALPSNRPTYRPRPPRRPRDLPWALAAVLFIPLSLLLPFHSSIPKYSSETGEKRSNWVMASSSTQASLSTTLSLILTTLIAITLCRVLYRTAGGGDGDDARHVAAKTIVSCSSVSFMMNFVLVVMIYWNVSDAWGFALIPLYFFIKDLILLREKLGFGHASSGSSSPRRSGIGSADYYQDEEEDVDGRRTFFRELVCMALDILSRSLRRSSFYRVLSISMIVQFAIVMLWKSALFVSIQAAGSDGGSKVLVLFVLLGGKWATGTVARLLGLIASGGITSWFAQQSILMEEMERMKSKKREHQQQQKQQQNQKQGEDSSSAKGSKAGTATGSEIDTMSDDYSVGYKSDTAAARAAARAALHAMPEAYRTADASAYRSVIEFDEGMDDDFDEDEDEEGEEDSFIGVSGGGGAATGDGRNTRRGRGIEGGGRGRRGNTEWTGGGSGGGSTVKSFLFSGVTVSFGSVAQCGLLGGVAQLVWSIVRNVDAAKLFVSRRLRGGGVGSGFRGMTIGGDGGMGDGGSSSSGQMGRLGGGVGGGSDFRQTTDWRQTAAMLWNRIDVMARAFVRSHSDLALSHVAAYFKGYNRAANDVAALIETSGVEPIIHDDITTHMCSSVCSAVSSCIVVIFGNFVANHRGMKGSEEELSDAAVCEIMLLVFIMCYTVMFTLMEPLRASIKAIYVCFAQHPQSLSQAFPLIFHRLSRISEANLV